MKTVSSKRQWLLTETEESNGQRKRENGWLTEASESWLFNVTVTVNGEETMSSWLTAHPASAY